jgi:hypothetical protein
MNEWIKVEDRMPEAHVIIIVLKNGFMENHMPYLSIYDGVSFLNMSSTSQILAHVTHWMPLPEQPQE